MSEPKVVHEYGDGWQIDNEGWRTNPSLQIMHKGEMHNAAGRHRDCHTQELARLAAEVERLKVKLGQRADDCLTLIAQRDALAAEVKT